MNLVAVLDQNKRKYMAEYVFSLNAYLDEGSNGGKPNIGQGVFEQVYGEFLEENPDFLVKQLPNLSVIKQNHKIDVLVAEMMRELQYKFSHLFDEEETALVKSCV